MDRLPEWLANLAEEDLAFIENFVLSSGSLKQMSQLYEVSYPTMRLRLDRLIEKIRLNDNETEDPFILLVKSLAIDDRYDVILDVLAMLSSFSRPVDSSLTVRPPRIVRFW